MTDGRLGFKKIITRLNGKDGYGKKVVFRKLECGHRVLESTWSTSRKAQYSFCRECSERATAPGTVVERAEEKHPTTENVRSIFIAAQVIYDALKPFSEENQRSLIMKVVFEVIEANKAYKKRGNK